MTRARTKYGAIRTQVGDVTFDSRAEAHRYTQLLLLQRAGVISDLELQPKFPLVVNGIKIGTYIGDFSFIEGGKRVTEDVKGIRTPVYILKKKLVRALYGIEIVEVMK